MGISFHVIIGNKNLNINECTFNTCSHWINYHRIFINIIVYNENSTNLPILCGI